MGVLPRPRKVFNSGQREFHGLALAQSESKNMTEDLKERLTLLKLQCQHNAAVAKPGLDWGGHRPTVEKWEGFEKTVDEVIEKLTPGRGRPKQDMPTKESLTDKLTSLKPLEYIFIPEVQTSWTTLTGAMGRCGSKYGHHFATEKFVAVPRNGDLKETEMVFKVTRLA